MKERKAFAAVHALDRAGMGSDIEPFAARQRMVLGQTRVGDKSNEIVAIPALLELLAIEGAVVTALSK